MRPGDRVRHKTEGWEGVALKELNATDSDALAMVYGRENDLWLWVMPDDGPQNQAYAFRVADLELLVNQPKGENNEQR